MYVTVENLNSLHELCNISRDPHVFYTKTVCVVIVIVDCFSSLCNCALAKAYSAFCVFILLQYSDITDFLIISYMHLRNQKLLNVSMYRTDGKMGKI